MQRRIVCQRESLQKNNWVLQLAHQSEPVLKKVKIETQIQILKHIWIKQSKHQCCIVRFAIRWQGATSVTVIQKVAGGEYQTDNGGSYEARHTWWQLFSNEIQWKQSKKFKNKG